MGSSTIRSVIRTLGLGHDLSSTEPCESYPERENNGRIPGVNLCVLTGVIILVHRGGSAFLWSAMLRCVSHVLSVREEWKQLFSSILGHTSWWSFQRMLGKFMAGAKLSRTTSSSPEWSWSSSCRSWQTHARRCESSSFDHGVHEGQDGTNKDKLGTVGHPY